MTLYFDAARKGRSYPPPERDDWSGLVKEPTYQERLVVAAKKTVAIFAGITKRNLLLRNEKGTPHTDGYSVVADFAQDTLYQDVEHELFHILFQSDPLAKRNFVDQYTKLVGKAAAAQGIELKKAPLATTIDFIIGLLEDHRVNSLGALFYPGSAKIIKHQDRDAVLPHSPRAHRSFLVYFACVETEIELEPGPLDVFRPIFEEALSKVYRRGFQATLLTAKWLVMRLVDEIIRFTRKQKGKGPLPGETPEPGQPGAEPVTAGERTEALAALIESCGTPEPLATHFSDVHVPVFASASAEEKAKEAAADALKANVNDEEGFDQALTESEEEMAKVIEQAKAALGGDGKESTGADDWLRRDAQARVIFHDVTAEEAAKADAESLTPQDEETIRRLRAMFVRVKGRRAALLEDAGTEIDTEAYIERLTTKQAIPVFKHEVAGRGFKALTLADLSSSMKSEVSRLTRATQITTRALRFPFVTSETWAFRSPDDGTVDIVRFPKDVEFVTTEKSRAEGSTPLHVAIRVAVRHLEAGNEAKQLFIVTDGHPHYSRKDGVQYGKAQLMSFVRQEVLAARAKGINVTCILIGADMTPKALSFMYGNPRHWRIMESEKFGPGLVQLVTTSFLDYLRHG